MKLFKYRPSPAMIVALLGLFVALAGTGVAATGGSFILGQSNTAGAKTSLNASTFGGKALELTNTNAASTATALGLNVAANHPPLVVSAGAGKATNLNADKLDGLESTGFIQGTGKAYQGWIAFTASGTVITKTVLSVPGFGQVRGTCDGTNVPYGFPPDLNLSFRNTSGQMLSMVRWYRFQDSTDYGEADLASNTSVDLAFSSEIPTMVIVQLGTNGKAVTITASQRRPNFSQTCSFQAQASATG